MRHTVFKRSMGLGLVLALGTLLPIETQAKNGFDLSTSLIFRGAIRSGGPPKDGIPALTNPKFIKPEAANYLKPDDLVVGLDMNGEAKAYPLRILVWHENANDTIGGQPVAVTYCPLCQSVLTFDRRSGGQVREFGVSGLLYNSNVLLYDRQPNPRKESLWSQGEMRAVTGPAAEQGLKMELLPSELTTWEDWKKRHPDTLVLSEDTGYLRSYRGEAYASYFATDQLMFTVKKQKRRPSRFKNKELLAVVYTRNGAKAYAANDVERVVGSGGVLRDVVGGRQLQIIHVPEGDTLRIKPADGKGEVPVAYMFWFALSSMQPHVELFDPFSY